MRVSYDTIKIERLLRLTDAQGKVRSFTAYCCGKSSGAWYAFCSGKVAEGDTWKEFVALMIECVEDKRI